MTETRNRILDVALDVLGQNPDAGMGEIASAAGVVRRTVYGHFPARADLIRALGQRAVDELGAVLHDIDVPKQPADAVWAEFVARLWPVARRYRVLIALRRGEFGEEIHQLLQPIDDLLADLVSRGQRTKVFGRHLPAATLSQIAYAAVFTVADEQPADRPGVRAATITSLLVLGVSEAKAKALAR